MIQFNLLPDVKIEYLKARRNKRLVVTGSLLLIAVSVFVLILLIGIVDVLQKKNLHDLNSDIASYSSQLKNTPNLNKILTIQNQLTSLPALYAKEPAASRLFGYLKQITPSSVGLTEMQVDFTQNLMTITGTANSLDNVNTYADTLKFTTYQTSSDVNSNATKDAFSSVVSQLSRSNTGASFTITLKFDPAIFNNASQVTLTVPNQISSGSVIGQPSDLFQNQGGQ